MITSNEIISLIYNGETQKIMDRGIESADLLFEILKDPTAIICYSLYYNTSSGAINFQVNNILAQIAKKEDAVFLKLIHNLKSENYPLIKNSIIVLGIVADKRATIPLLVSFLNLSENHQSEIIQSLGKIAKCNEESFNFLHKIFFDLEFIHFKKLGPFCALALGLCGFSEVSNYLFSNKFENGNLDNLRDGAIAEICKNDPNTFRKVIEGLFEENPKSSMCTRILLILYHDPQCNFSSLFTGFLDENNTLSQKCLLLLEKKGLFLEHAKICAIRILANLKDKTSVDLLISLMLKKDRDLSHEAAKALEQINDSKGLSLKKIIYDKDKEYIRMVGLKHSIVVLCEYLHIIEGCITKEEQNLIKIEFLSLFRNSINSSVKNKSELDLLHSSIRRKPPILHNRALRMRSCNF